MSDQEPRRKSHNWDIENQLYIPDEIETDAEYLNSSKIIVESWTDKKEELVMEWRDILSKDADIHGRASENFKQRNRYDNNIIITIPVVMTIVQLIFAFIDETQIDQVTLGTGNSSTSLSAQRSTQLNRIYILINGIAYAILGLLQQRNIRNKNGTNSEVNVQYKSRYYDIISKIDSELSREKEYRTVADVFIEGLRCNISNLKNNAPPVI